MAGIHFFYEDTPFKLKQILLIKRWLRHAITHEEYALQHLNFIFCSDEYLLTINRRYLQHDYYTDIITFDNSETPGKINGDIFISIDRVKENAAALHLPETEELRRILIHGVLHLLGYTDKSPGHKKEMTAKEDYYLQAFSSIT